MEQTATMTLRASDVSGQKRVRASAVPSSFTVSELVQRLIDTMGLNRDVRGQPIAFHALLEREGRHLHGTEIVGDVLHEEDEVVISPSIDAG